MIVALIVAIALAAIASPGSAQRPPDAGASEVIALHRAWWRAFTYGDLAALDRLSDNDMHVVLSSGRSFDRTAAMDDARARGDSSFVQLAWANERAVVSGPMATIHSRFTEQAGAQGSDYQFLTVLRRTKGAWRVLAAQSTLIPKERRAVAADRDELQDIAGQYRGSGLVVTLSPGDSGLTLSGLPQGTTLIRPLAPVRYFVAGAPVQVIFVRSRDGRITGFDALTPGGDMHFDRVP